MSKPLKVGVIGLGVGEQHAISYNEIEGVEVVALCDIDPGQLTEVADRQGISSRHTDYKAITENPDIDIVSICSYDDHHVEQAISAFENGKHVMVEKPVALNRGDAERLLRAQQDSGKFITSNLILRHSARFKELKGWIDAGDFGDIVAMEGDYIHQILWKLTEGWRGKMDFYCVTYGGGIHLIDLMRWLIGQEVVEVTGMGNQILTAGTQYKYPDTIINLLRFDGGAIAKNMSILGPQRTQLHALNVYGTKKTFVNDTPNAKLFDGDDAANEHVVTTPYPGIRKGDLLPGFIDAIREGREPLVGARDIFRVMDICFAAWESVQSGRTVKGNYQI